MTAETILRKHYGCGPLTGDEIAAELADLRRRHANGSLDDRDLALYVRLGLDRA